MGVLTRSHPRAGGGRIGIAGIVLAAALVAIPARAHVAGNRADVTPDVALKAAFLYNFAKFAEWPALIAGTPIIACIVGDEGLAGALVEAVRGRNISGHALEVRRPQDSATWRSCHLLFIADSEVLQSADALGEIRTLPVLTVSDAKGFAKAGGIIELYAEKGRMRFAINVDASERSGLRLSSRLLGLARIVRETDAQ